MLNSSSETYKPTSLYRTMVWATKTISPNPAHEDAKYIPNFTTAFKTHGMFVTW